MCMENRITLRAVLEVLNTEGFDPKDVEVTVNSDPVWDYKDLDGELRLIHENNSTTGKYDHVTVGELMQEEFLDLPIQSEHVNIPIVEAEVLKFKNGKRIVNFRFED